MQEHVSIHPAIHYWGTPVVLLSTLNADGSPNIAPMSSVWWLGQSAMLGLDASSQTVTNLRARPECVINLVDAKQADVVNRLAKTTGAERVPLHKKLLGYRHVKDKAAAAALALSASVYVSPPRVANCDVQLEASVVRIRSFADDDAGLAIPACCIEVRIRRCHVRPWLLAGANRIDPTRWQPMLMCFRRLFGMGEESEGSVLAKGDESAYAPQQQSPAYALAARVLKKWNTFQYGVSENHEEG